MTEATHYAQQIDTEAAVLYGEAAARRIQYGYAQDALHRAAGDTRPRTEEMNRRGQWTGHYLEGPWELTDDEARVQVSLKHDAGGYHGDRHTAAVTRLDAETENLRRIHGRMNVLRDIYEEHGWSRFFLVKNHGGHIHSSMTCSTCHDTTDFGWLPGLSGLTEAEAVAAHGAILCTVCYPSAPVEWTDGGRKADDDTCPGSGKDFAERRPGGRYGICSACGKSVAKTQYLVARKHKK